MKQILYVQYRHLSVMLILMFFSFSISATMIDGIEYELNEWNHSATVTSYWGYIEYSGEVVIPSVVSYDGEEYTVTEIDQLTFAGSLNLTSISIPNTVVKIGVEAFSGCSRLTSIVLPVSLTDIEEYVFRGCSGLASVIIPNSVTRIQSNAFSDCTGMISLVIGNSVTHIGGRAFKNTGLQEIFIPNNVMTIGSHAFEDCLDLKDVIIEDSEELLDCEDHPFYNSDIESLYIGRDVVERYHDSLFSGTSLVHLEFGCNVTQINPFAFNYCSGLTSLTIPNTIISIGERAFADCSGLTDLTFPSSLTSIGKNAFEYCTGLTRICIPESVTSIGDRAFNCCYNLKDIYYDTHVPTEFNSEHESIFDSSIYDKATLWVQEQAIDRCREIEPWKYFQKIDAYDFEIGQASIKGVNGDLDSHSVSFTKIYDLNGVEVSETFENANPGIYIMREEKTIKKILIR